MMFRTGINSPSGMGSLLKFMLVASTMLKTASAGSLNPFDDDPTPDPSNNSGGGGVTPPASRVYSCPADNSARYTTNGVTFELRCGQGTTASVLRNEEGCPSLSACADKCALELRCQSCDWNAGTRKCVLFSQYIPTVPNPNVNTWFPVQKRQDGTPNPADPGGPKKCDPPGEAPLQCPEDNRKTYTTPNGKNYMLKCDYQSPNAPALKNTPCSSMMDCANQCSETEESVICDWAPNNCAMKKSYVEPFHAPGGGVHTWVDIDKNPDVDPCYEDFPDEATIVCSTECPSANGMVHDTPTGERFILDCGRKHGVKWIYKDMQSSLKDCVDACGALLACHSVDWNKNTQICYYGQHHGQPQVVAAAYASARSIGCAGACGEEKGCCGE